jgi:hypothetical protein
MDKFLPYLVESGICLLVFFVLYQAVLKRETFYQLNRGFLLFSILFSLLVPLMNIRLQRDPGPALMAFRMEPITISASGGYFSGGSRIISLDIIRFIYLSGIILFGLRIILNINSIRKLYRRGKRIPGRHYDLILHSMKYPPFSFFQFIFISEMHYSGKKLDDIIEHEKAHVRQMHSVDAILTELLIILQWFNPMAWLFKKLVTENHEFLADEAVINRGFSPEAYRLRIVAELFGIRSMPAAHNFNQSITQKRLKMMEKSKSTAASRLKFLLVLPPAMWLFYLFACSSQPADSTAKDTPETSGQPEVYYKVDVAAEPEGGVQAFQQYIAQNIKYPAEAVKKGVQGKVYIQFIVDENGNLVKVVQSSEVPPPPPPAAGAEGEVPPPPPPPEKIVLGGIVVVGYKPPEGIEQEYAKEDVQLLADEAIRVIVESSLKWKPALKDGKPVRSAWTIPIVFKLD